MSEPSLIPRKYKIEQSINEYTYFIVWIIIDNPQIGKWAVQIGPYDDYLNKDFRIKQINKETALFDTSEEAFEFWKKYISLR